MSEFESSDGTHGRTFGPGSSSTWRWCVFLSQPTPLAVVEEVQQLSTSGNFLQVVVGEGEEHSESPSSHTAPSALLLPPPSKNTQRTSIPESSSGHRN